MINNSIYSNSWSMIFANCPTVAYKGGTIIIEEGSRIDKVYFIKKGKVKFSVITPDGNEKTMYYLNKGGIFADICSISNRPFFMTATAVTYSTLCYMDPDDFMEVLNQNNSIVKEWTSSLSEIMEFLMEQITDIAFLDKESMLCKYLYRMSLNYGVQTETGIKINNKVTHQFLAELIGCSRVTVSKIMSILIKNGIINKKKGYFFITDLEELKKYTKDISLAPHY